MKAVFEGLRYGNFEGIVYFLLVKLDSFLGV